MSAAVVEAMEERRVGSRRELVGPFVVFLVLISATIPWRTKTYYEGGADPVVIAKAFLSIVGLGLALVVGLGRPLRRVPAAPLVFCLAYLTCTVLGALAAGTAVAAAVVAIRVVILALAVLLLARRFDSQALVGCLVAALGLYALSGAVTGLSTLSTGRLAGVFPRLHPNDLAYICGLVILWCVWQILNGRDTLKLLAALFGSGLALIATGSRTPLLALAVSGIVLLVYARAVRVRTALLAAVVLPLLLWVVTGTGIVEKVLLRNQDASQISTLSNRTIAWNAALGPKDSAWMEWLGGGLSLKEVAVPGQWWNSQILDSSWISAIVQGGWIGAGICLAWVIYSFVRAFDTPLPFRAIQQALIVYLAVRGILESGLFDATTAFLMFFVTVLATPVRQREPAATGSPIPL